MALPLPRVISDVGPGGGAVTSMRGMNALSNDMLQNQITAVKAQYAPWTEYANAISKIAYATLLGPQYVAKLEGNPNVVANSPELQDPRTIKRLHDIGMSLSGGVVNGGAPGGTMPNQGGFYPPLPGSQPNNPFSNWMKNGVGQLVQGAQQRASSNPANPLAYNNSPQQQPQQQLQTQPQQQVTQDNTNPESNSEVSQAISAWMQSPEATELAQKQGMYTIPQMPQLMQWYRARQGGQQGAISTPPVAPPKTYAENAGELAGTIEEGKESGKIRAQDIKELNDTVFNSDTKLATLNDINSMISSPLMREIRQLPLAGRHEMAWYAKEGTPAQQQLVGRLYAQLGNVVKDSSRDFAGQFRTGEQQLLQNMKPNDSDTIDVMIGKSESLTVMIKLLRERSALASKYMNQFHINKLQATEIADKELNGNAIRSQVHDTLNPTVTIRNPKTGEQITIPASEARQGGFKGG